MHVYEEFVQKSTAFIVSISAQLKLPTSPDTHSGDNQHIHASSFRSYLKELLVSYGKTKESKRADESTQSDKQSPSQHAKAEGEIINYKEIVKARASAFLATAKGELWLSLPFSLQLPGSAGRALTDPHGPAAAPGRGRNTLT